MKKILAVMLVVAVLSSMLCFTACEKDNDATIDSGERLTVSIGYADADETWKNDDYYKYITDKLNMDIEFESIPKSSLGEKARIWISSGSMPDVTYADFSVNEYLKYGEQGIVKPLPKGWEKKYPNLAFSMEMTGIMDTLKEAGNGEIYGLVCPMDHYKKYIEEFRQAFKDGKDLREMMSQPEYIYIDTYGFAYRKDWAKELGIETDYIMEYEDFLDMIRKFKEADLGGVGATNTVGLAIDHTEAPNFFVTAFNSSYKYFHKNSKGKYVCGLLEDSTTEGLKEYSEAYKTGILAPDFYTQKSQDLNSLFCSERSGVIFPKANVSSLRTLNADFEKANPGLKAEDCIDVCWVLSPDGKLHGREASNYYRGYYFNPEISDEKMHRLLALADYIASEEGGPQISLGIPDVDYVIEDGEYKIIREKNASGTYDTLDKKYPSYSFFRMFINPNYSLNFESDPYALKCADTLDAEKRKHELSILDWDDARNSYTDDEYIKFNAAYDVNSMFAELIVEDGDIVKNWEKKKAEFSKKAKKIASDMNKALLK